MDFELEIGTIVGTGNKLGHPMTIEQAKKSCPAGYVCKMWIDPATNKESGYGRCQLPTAFMSAPTPAPPPAGGAGFCCFWSPTNNGCDCPEGSKAKADNWCAASEERCDGCNAKWCAGGR